MVDKFTKAPKNEEIVPKINEIIDNLSSSGNFVTTDTAQDITGAKTFTQAVTIQNGAGTGSLLFGGDVNASTSTANTRKLGRINSPTYTDPTLSATLLGWDTSGDINSPVTNNSMDAVCFGGMKKITNCTSPMSLVFCVTNTRNATAANNKIYALAMDSNAAIFGVQPKYNNTNLALSSDIPTQASDIGAQEELVSGINIKTINNESILGSGNISISGGTPTDVQINGTSITSNDVANIITESAYNTSTNKIATMADVPTITFREWS